MRKIAIFLNHKDLALNYLQNALGVAKSGEIPISFILKIHYKLGISYYKRTEIQEALHHFTIIINFLEKEEISSDKEEYLGLAYLYIGLIYLEQDKVDECKNYFKNAFQIGNENLFVKLKYFLLRGIYYKNHVMLFLAYL